MPIDTEPYNMLRKLFDQNDIKESFDKIFLKKLRIDGYCDLSKFIIEHRITKHGMQIKLQSINSRFDVLYSNPYPKKDNALNFWNKYVKEKNDSKSIISDLEAIAIVNWIYKILKKEERIGFTYGLLWTTPLFSSYEDAVSNVGCVFYDSHFVEVELIRSFDDFNNTISRIHAEVKEKDSNIQLFFRGHSNVNHILIPSILRNQKLKDNECKIYNELIIECPYDFEKCHTHLEKLVLMQHYGLPTRLLDITRNPLIALFFASRSEINSYGEVIIIPASEKQIKYPQSDTVSVLASLPLFSKIDQNKFRNAAKDNSLSNIQFNNKVKRLLHEVRLEKPAFLPEINKNDITNSFIVNALKNNNRIIKQDGAFIICGLLDDKANLDDFRYYGKDYKKTIILIDNKKEIQDKLNACSINHATLFPEIECVSEYIKNKYLKY